MNAVFTEHALEPYEYGVRCMACGQSWKGQPKSVCPGVKLYSWGKWPENLLTKKQLADAGYSTGASLLPAPAGAVWRDKSPDGIMWLYDRDKAKPKRVLSAEAKAVVSANAKRLAQGWCCARCGERLKRYKGGYCEDCTVHNRARDWARDLLSRSDEWVILDTETTGLTAGWAEIIDLALIDGHGKVLLDTYVKPEHPERVFNHGGRDCSAYDIHGIHPDALESAPTFPDVYEEVFRLVKNKTVLIYNAPFDIGMLEGDCEQYHLPRLDADDWQDVMIPYSRWVGEYSRYWGDYRWQPLDGGHSALSDCLATLNVLKRMAEMEKISES